MSESFAELFEESLVKTQMRPGSIIPGTVVQIDDDFIVVNAGLKSEGVIPSSQFMNDKGELEGFFLEFLGFFLELPQILLWY